MPNLQSEDSGRPGTPTPDGFDGHVSTGYDCLACGAHVKPRYVTAHRDWHEKIGRVMQRVTGAS